MADATGDYTPQPAPVLEPVGKYERGYRDGSRDARGELLREYRRDVTDAMQPAAYIIAEIYDERDAKQTKRANVGMLLYLMGAPKDERGRITTSYDDLMRHGGYKRQRAVEFLAWLETNGYATYEGSTGYDGKQRLYSTHWAHRND